MSKSLYYLANIRLPSEKAHVYQIMQMCEAFAETGVQVTLLHADRRNVPELESIEDVWAHYDVVRNFEREKIPCMDWYPLTWQLRGVQRRVVELVVAWVQRITYALVLVWRVRPGDADIFYSRHHVSLIILLMLRPHLRQRTIYESHSFPVSRIGIWLRRWLIKRVAGTIVITGHLARLYKEKLAVSEDRITVAHDAVRLERFANLPDRATCRAQLGLPSNAFIVGYVGQLHLMGMSKGLDTLTEAMAQLARSAKEKSPVYLCIVGGPADMVTELRQMATQLGLADNTIITPGRVAPHDVPSWMHAFDVCTLPSPWNTFFAYYTSPLKLFEYMASGTAIVASDLPSFAEILTDGHNALLTPPSDSAALANAISRMRDDPILGERLARQARWDVEQYTWRARADELVAFSANRMLE